MFIEVCTLFLLLSASSEADPGSECVKKASNADTKDSGQCKAFYECCKLQFGSCKAGVKMRCVTAGDHKIHSSSACACAAQPSQKPEKQQDIATFREDALKTHNNLRKRHGANPLKIDKDLNKIAQDYAKDLSKHNRSQIAHSYREGVGENIYWSSASTSEGKHAVNAWYNEIENPGYNFSSPGFTKGTGHMTQVLWKGTKQVGCGMAKSEHGIFVVCNYKPAGNVVKPPGLFEQNVLPAKD